MAEPGNNAAGKALLLERLVAAFVQPYLANCPNAARALQTLQQLPVRGYAARVRRCTLQPGCSRAWAAHRARLCTGTT